MLNEPEAKLISEAKRTEQILLNTVVCKLGSRDCFGISAIQRVCKIGYNQANRVVERGINDELLYRPENDYKLAFTDKAHELRKQIFNL